MTPTQFIISTDEDDRQYVTAITLSEGPLVADDEHPAFTEIVEALLAGADEAEIAPLFDASQAVAQAFDGLSERVSVANGRVYFDGDAQHDAIAKHIVRALNEGDELNALALARFMEKLAANPSARSREQLYEWLNRHAFTITPDGDVLMYKGVRRDFTSINTGKAVVDGQSVNGAVPNALGSTVEFPRAEVEDDAARGCARGLHAGTYEYASSFARGATLTVKVNPRDVVSVPTDCDAQKVRTCRYRVVEIAERPYTEAVADVADEGCDCEWCEADRIADEAF